MIPRGYRCPPSGKDRCEYRGYYGRSRMMYCKKYKKILTQGRKASQQSKCRACMESETAAERARKAYLGGEGE